MKTSGASLLGSDDDRDDDDDDDDVGIDSANRDSFRFNGSSVGCIKRW